MKRIFLAGLLALCLLASLPMVAFAVNAPGEEPGTSDTEPLPADETDEATALVACTATEGCTLAEGHEGDCVLSSTDDGGDNPDSTNSDDSEQQDEDEPGDDDALEQSSSNESTDPDDTPAEGGGDRNTDGNTSQWAEGTVAVIGEAEYSSLEEAINTTPANTPTSIELIDDVLVTEGIYISSKNITLISSVPHSIAFNIPTTDATGSNGFGITNGGFLSIGGNVTVTTANDTFRALVNVYGAGSEFELAGGELSSGNADISRGIVCVDGGGSFTLSGGTIRGNEEHESVGVYLQEWIENNAPSPVAFTMTGGLITDCHTENQGGGVCVNNNREITFQMRGGRIENCSASSKGGAVAMGVGTFTMSGGTISGCSAPDGSGIYLKSGADFSMTGGTVTDCPSDNGNLISVRSTAQFTMTGGSVDNLIKVGDELYTSLQDAINATNGTKADPTTIIIMGDMTLDRPVTVNGKHIVLTSNAKHTITLNIGSNFTDDDLTRINCISIGESSSLEINAGNLTITTSNIALRSLVNVCGENSYFHLEDGTLCSGGANLSRAIVCLDNNAAFEMSGGVIRGNHSHQSRGVILQSYKASGITFIMSGGCIEDCHVTTDASGGGVSIIGSCPAAFAMTGGMITNCSSPRGGGVYVNVQATVNKSTDYGDVFVMEGGTISNCTSTDRGGAIFLEPSTEATIRSGTISGCSATNGGGAVYVHTNAVFSMDGGTIKDSESENTDGGGVCVNGGTFNMNGGAISKCSAKGNGGAVYVNNGGTFNMNGGAISECSAKGNGGAVYVNNGSDNAAVFNMSAGTISESEAGKNGGAVCAQNSAVVTMGAAAARNADSGGGATISKCSSDLHGGGIFLSGTVKFTMHSGKITGCTAAQGGGVWAQDTVAFTLNDGTISSCTVESVGAKGGGIYLNGKDVTFRMNGGTIEGNTCEYLGGGIYTESDGTISAGLITGNQSTCETGYGGGIYVHKEATLRLYNTVVKGNTATSMGGGIWACRTGDIKVYVTDGGAVYDNTAQEEKGILIPNPGAGDDFASYAKLSSDSSLTLYARMLGGGLNHYYLDGGVTSFSPSAHGHHHNEGVGLGAPSENGIRYNEYTHAVPYVHTENEKGSVSLKNIVSDADKTAAEGEAKLIIANNTASRGGGIGTNGNLIIGTPDEETYSVTVKKAWSNDTPEEKKTAVSVYLKIGEEKLGPVTLNKENGWTASFTGLTDKPDKVKYAVAEDPVPEGFTPSYSEAAFNGMAGTIVVTNTYSPLPPAPKTGSLTVSKTVSGDGADHSKDFQFTVALADSTFAGPYGDMTFTEGKAVFTLKDGESKTAEGLPAGIGYTVTESDNVGYTVTKTGDAGNIPADQTAEAHFNNHKDSGSPDGDTVDVTVKKVWKLDDGGKAAELVTVALLQDGKLYATAELTGDNGWQHTWNGLDSRYNWTVEELNIPNGFTASTEKQGMTFTIINDDIPDAPPIDPIQPDVPDNPEPPHTGVFRYPVWLPILAAGALLAIIGLAGKKKHPGKHKS